MTAIASLGHWPVGFFRSPPVGHGLIEAITPTGASGSVADLAAAYAAGATGSRLMRRRDSGAASSTVTSPPTVGSPATNAGGSRENRYPDSRGGTEVLALSGTRTYRVLLSSDAVTPLTATVTIILYAVATNNATRELTRTSVAGVSIPGTGAGVNANVNLSLSGTLAVGEIFQYEIYVNVTNNSNIVSCTVRIPADDGVLVPASASLISGGTAVVAFSRSALDSAPASDGPTGRQVLFPRSRTETASAVDSLGRSQILTRHGTETASAADVLGRTYRASRGLIDTTTVADTLARALILTRARTESALAVDTLGVSFVGSRQLIETRTTADTLARQFVGKRICTETAAAADTLARTVVFKRNLTDNTTVSDSAVRQASLTRRLTESAPALDSLGRVLTNVRSVTDNIGPSGGPADWPGTNFTKSISGVVRDNGGTPISGAGVKLFRQSDDFFVGERTSNASGEYSFQRDDADPYSYYTIAYVMGTPQTHGTSDRGLLPT